MYAFRDIQVEIIIISFHKEILIFILYKDYQSMIELSKRCRQYDIISKKIQNNMRILYLTAFAQSR